MFSTGLVLLALAIPVDEPCPVDFRGVPLGEAVAELAGRLQMPYVFDESVTAADLTEPVRMRAEYLTGLEVIIWLARLADLEGVHQQGAMFLARPARLPVSWKSANAADCRNVAGDSDSGIQLRRARISWLDTPMSQVAADVREGFGIDVIVHPVVLKRQRLVTHEADQASVADVCQVLAAQWECDATIVDGVVWIRPVGWQKPPVPPASCPGDTATEGPWQTLSALQSSNIAVINRGTESWKAFADCLERCNVVCDIREDPASRYPDLVARGPVEDILEGARLIGAIRWERVGATASGQRKWRIEMLSPQGQERARNGRSISR
jgi:hypothetical protein